MTTGNEFLDLEFPVEVWLAAERIPLEDLLRLEPGGLLRLRKDPDLPVDLVVNGTRVATGELVVVDSRFGFKVTSTLGGRLADLDGDGNGDGDGDTAGSDGTAAELATAGTSDPDAANDSGATNEPAVTAEQTPDATSKQTASPTNEPVAKGAAAETTTDGETGDVEEDAR